MKYLLDYPISSAAAMFAAIVTMLSVWISYRPSIKAALLASQNFIFGWMI